MFGIQFARLIERHSEELAEGLVKTLQKSERTVGYRVIPSDTLRLQLEGLYRNLSAWLTTKTDSEIRDRYVELALRRAEQGITVDEFTWALIAAKEHLWHFLRREAITDQAFQLLREIDFLLLLDQFFDRAVYYGVTGFRKASLQAA